jgi:hypothetical protein
MYLQNYATYEIAISQSTRKDLPQPPPVLDRTQIQILFLAKDKVCTHPYPTQRPVTFFPLFDLPHLPH